MDELWDEIDNITVDAKNDMLMQALIYAHEHKIDTVEMQIEFKDKTAINAKVTFSMPDNEVEDDPNAGKYYGDI